MVAVELYLMTTLTDEPPWAASDRFYGRGLMEGNYRDRRIKASGCHQIHAILA
jgi:hypothetical protein